MSKYVPVFSPTSRQLIDRSRSLIRTARQSFATVAHHPLPPAPIWDTFVYQPIGHVDAESRASPVATSSRVTLDHLLVRPPSRLSSVPLKIAENTTNDGFADWTGAGEALAFATDEELVHALLLPHLGSTAIVGEHDWHRSLDPALAFHALRSRGSYPAFLRSIRPYIRSLFPRLRSARVHQLFVSDLLLRHPDPLVFRDILQMDGEVVQKRTVVQESGASEKLRASLVCSLYSIIRPDERARYALTAQTNLSICRAMMQTSDWGGLERAWTDLYDTADNLPESNYQLLRFLVKLEPHRRDTAMGLFSTMVTTGTARLPMGVMGRVDDAHPEAAQLLLRTAMVKACCRWKLYQRAQTGVGEMLDVAVGGTGGVSHTCCGALAAGHEGQLGGGERRRPGLGRQDAPALGRHAAGCSDAKVDSAHPGTVGRCVYPSAMDPGRSSSGARHLHGHFFRRPGRPVNSITAVRGGSGR